MGSLREGGGVVNSNGRGRGGGKWGKVKVDRISSSGGDFRGSS